MSAATPDYVLSEDRWAALGPYYAMFPLAFAARVVDRYSAPNQRVLDPFAGRASSIYAAARTGREGVGIEINPVGWLYGRVKLNPAPKPAVLERIDSLAATAEHVSSHELQALPRFFTLCYAPKVRQYLVAARQDLDWRANRTDATLMAFLLVYLHGKRSQSLSNQMRQGKAMAPDYSIRWWEEHHMKPPRVDPVAFLKRRVEWRYKRGAPGTRQSTVHLGDSRWVTRRIQDRIEKGAEKRFHLLFTSPPYCGITNYHYDQWLRLWLLGGPSRPVSPNDVPQGRFRSPEKYAKLLRIIFERSAALMRPDATVYVRTDAREFTKNTTRAVLAGAFPRHVIRCVRRPYERKTQTALYGDTSDKPGEVDFILRR